MNNREIPLVFFTVFSQLAVGLAVMAAMILLGTTALGHLKSTSSLFWACFLSLGCAMGFSLFHLGHPAGSFKTLAHLRKSWLSREILGFGAMGVLVFINGFSETIPQFIRPGLAVITAMTCILATYASARAYSVPGYPALNNPLPFIFFTLTAMTLGLSFLVYFTIPGQQTVLVRWLFAALFAGCIIHLAVPSVWIAGGRIMKMTGQAYYKSHLYWIRIIGEFIIPLIIIETSGKIPIWMPFLLLGGELIGRVLFFSHVAHTSSNLGGRY